MTGFMVNLEGVMKICQVGSIKISRGLDRDGIHGPCKTLFRLVWCMPRALALVYGGLLYAESPTLWFC